MGKHYCILLNAFNSVYILGVWVFKINFLYIVVTTSMMQLYIFNIITFSFKIVDTTARVKQCYNCNCTVKLLRPLHMI